MPCFNEKFVTSTVLRREGHVIGRRVAEQVDTKIDPFSETWRVLFPK